MSTNLYEEGDRLPSIQQAVIISQSKIHHLIIRYISKLSLNHVKESSTYRADLNFAVHGNRLVLDSVKSKNS